jgi:hypothetical protein
VLALVLSLVFPLVLGGGSVRAAPDKREVEARADFAAGRYQQAIDLFAQLYGETLNPIYLRNIGRCQQGLNQAEPAIKSFREYLKKAKGLKPDERLEIEGYIKEMEATLAAQQAPTSPSAAAPPATPSPAAAPPATPPSSPPAPAAGPPPAPAPSPAPASAAPVPPPGGTAAPLPGSAPVAPGPASSESGTVPGVTSSPPPSQLVHPWLVPGIVVTAVGAALVGTGVAFGISAKNDADAVSAAYDPSQADAGRRNAKIGFAADIVGAAAVVTGIVLIAHGANAPAPPAFGLRAGALADSRSGFFLLEGTF